MIGHYKKIILCTFCSLLLFFVGAYSQSMNIDEMLHIKEQQVLVSKEQAEQRSVLALTERWYFTPDKHIAPEQVDAYTMQPIDMPYIIRNVQKATHRIKLCVPEINRIYSLRFVSSSNSQKIWVNNVLIDEYNISRNTDTIVFYAHEENIDIVIHSASNGGNLSVVESPLFGTVEQMKNLKYSDFGFNLFITTIFSFSGFIA